MSERSVRYQASQAARALLPAEVIDALVRLVVDRAYDRNLMLNGKVCVKRFNLFTVDGLLADGGSVAAAARDRPAAVGQVLPIVLLTEIAGEDHADVFLQSEVASDPALRASPAVCRLAAQPPDLTLEDLLTAAREGPLR